MSLPLKRRVLVIASCLFMSACTETIIREVTPTSDPVTTESSAQTPAISEGANMVSVTPPVSNPTVGGTSNMTPAIPAVGENPTVTTATPATEPPSTDAPTSVVVQNTPESEVETPSIPGTGIQLQDPTTDMTIGEPGVLVDCQQTLPCRWISEEGQFSLTVTNADNIASRSRLSINYSIVTAHDTQVFVSRANDAVDAEGLTYKATDQALGGGNGGTPQGVVAGAPVEGTLNFDSGTSSASITQWSIAILDGGMLRAPSFINIPVGTITTAQADCQNTLPCVWTTPLNDVAITLQSVGGISLGSRLTANFSIEAATNMSVAVDGGSTAYGNDGTPFEARTHTLVTETNYLKVSAESTANIPVHGSINFYRTESVPESLELMSLVIYRDDPVPRWNPTFINVPVL